MGLSWTYKKYRSNCMGRKWSCQALPILLKVYTFIGNKLTIINEATLGIAQKNTVFVASTVMARY
jgi:hypothetical protein